MSTLRRPRLVLPFRIVPEPDTVRLLGTDGVCCTLTGPNLEDWLPDWLALLDGRNTLDEALERLPPMQRAPAAQLVERLNGERILIDGRADDAHTAVRCRLVPEGNAAWAAAWLPAGDASARPLPVLCQDRLDYDEALRFNQRCRETGSAWLWASTGPMSRAYVGPLFLPDAGPCLGCLLRHFRRLSPAPEIYDALATHARGGGRIVPAPFPPAGIAIVRQLLLWKVRLMESPAPVEALYRLHVVETASLEVSSHRVFVDPECPECRGPR
jgi:bacteriocin biosynthesis cyclodehydratase domain-containing protein